MFMDYANRPIIVHTAYTFEQVRALERHQYLRERKQQALGLGRKGVIAVIMSAGFLFVMSALSPNSSGIPAVWWVVGIAGILMLVLSEVYRYRASRGLTYTLKKHEKVKEGVLANGQSYTFRAGEFDAEACVATHVSKGTMSYNTLHSVEEDEDSIYIYNNDQRAYIVDKRGFETGTPEELRNLLSKSLPPEKCKFLELPEDN